MIPLRDDGMMDLKTAEPEEEEEVQYSSSQEIDRFMNR
jgi:hypothetical protein